MSRSGRAIDLLNEWREHPSGCTADHGWADGYSGWCGDDAFGVLQLIDTIDPFFLRDKIARLEKALAEAKSKEPS